MTDIISHPRDEQEDVRLDNHLRTVASRCQSVAPDNEKEVEWIVGMLHDIGKSHPKIQDYLKGDSTLDHPNHSPIGAVITFETLSQLGYDEETVLAATFAVAKHHGSLSTATPTEFLEEHYRSDANRTAVIRDLVTEIRADKDANEFVTNHLDETTKNKIEPTDILDAIESGETAQKLEDSVTEGALGLPSNDALSENTYYSLLSYWGSLAYADITHAVSPDTEDEDLSYTRPTAHAIDAYVEELRNGKLTPLDNIREDARAEALSTVDSVDWTDVDVATLSLPTGLGKTLTGTSAALKILDQSQSVSNGSEYISTDSGGLIYALPFTSIIDQTHDIFADIFETSPDIDSTLTVHHHLAETVVDNGEWDGEMSEVVGASWRSGVTLTTFVQLFESILGPSRREGMKLPQLQNSVIILDEPQSLPSSWWVLLRRLARLLSNQYGATIVSMTATPPYIFEDDEKLTTKPLLQDSESYYDLPEVERVSYEFDKSVFTDENCSHTDIARKIEPNLSDGALAICNTIDSANVLSQNLLSLPQTSDANEILDDWYSDEEKNLLEYSELSPEEIDVTRLRERLLTDSGFWKTYISVFQSYVCQQTSSPAIVTLTSRHRPLDRRLLLSLTDMDSDDAPPVTIVSTQVVEAGVDISFKHVYRDFAPAPNIVQAAGRCNREGGDSNGTVTVAQLNHPDGDEDNKLPGEAVYGRGTNLLNLTRQSLEDNKVVPKQSIKQKRIGYDVVQTYYHLLRERNPGDELLATHVDECQLDALSSLSLIDSTRDCSVVVSRGQSEASLVASVRRAWGNGDYNRVNEVLDLLQHIQVNLPVYSEEQEGVAQESFEPLLPTQSEATLLTDELGFHQSKGLELPDTSVSNRLL